MRYRQYRNTKPRLDPERNRDRDYVMLREAWRARHPDATSREYEEAMRKIAARLGI